MVLLTIPKILDGDYRNVVGKSMHYINVTVDGRNPAPVAIYGDSYETLQIMVTIGNCEYYRIYIYIYILTDIDRETQSSVLHQCCSLSMSVGTLPTRCGKYETCTNKNNHVHIRNKST